MNRTHRAERTLLAVVSALLITVSVILLGAPRAAASPSSGLPAGPVGTPVISTVDYTNRSAVLIVGDSITVRGYKYLQAAMPTTRLAVNAQSGRNTRLSIDSLITQLNKGAKLPPELVMATGANDIFDTHAMAPQVRRLVALVAAKSPTTKVFWVDVSVRRPGFVLADMFNSAMVNTAIRTYCKCTVISWAGYLQRYGRAGIIDSGGVHPTVAGAEAWGKLIATAVTR